MIKHLTLIGMTGGVALMLASVGVAQTDQGERQTSGDILMIEKVLERMSRDLPGNGLTMAEVERRFGSPAQRAPAVGEPPITRWTYDDYSVYFEHELVLESVLHPEAVIRDRTQGRN